MGRSNLRKGRYSESGQIYSVTFTTRHRLCLLDFDIGRLFVKKIHQPKIMKDHELLCWVVMPDHVHLLLMLGECESLSVFMQRLKSETSKKIKSEHGIEESIWADGFYDRTLRSDEQIKVVARYIVANPIRTGLVKSVRQYALWDAIWL